MEEFDKREIEIYDRIATLIGSDLVSIEFNTKDKSKLEYLLCANSEEKQKVTQKKVKRYKKEIDNCTGEIAGYLLALADIFDNGQYFLERVNVTKSFISDYYDDLVQILVKEDKDISEILDLEDLITSYGFSYELILDYIFGVSNMFFYQYYKLCLDTHYEILSLDEIESKNNIKSIADSFKIPLQNEEVNSEVKVLTDNLSITMTYNENLSNDPLFDKTNEYENLKSVFLEEYNSRTGQYPDYDYLLTANPDVNLEEWEKIEKEKLDNIFLKMVKDLNQKKTFFFGCSFANYEYNYTNRLNQFLDNFYDTSELEFINEELEFLENILYDIQNSEGAHDGYSQSGIKNFLKAYDFISITGYKQYFFSHNKKVEFLELKKNKLNKEELSSNGTPNLIEEDDQNDILKSTIEDYLEEFKEEINTNGYQVLVNALFEYFTNDTFPILISKINFKSINKKRVGWALKELYKSEKTVPISFEYISFAKDNINLFTDEIFEKHNFRKSNLYKIFTTNPAK